jgi:ABC-2 type transport system permease protein
VTLVVLALLVFLGWATVLTLLPNFLAGVVRFISLSTHFDYIALGYIRLNDIVYYLTVIVFFLFLTRLSIESRKWK